MRRWLTVAIAAGIATTAATAAAVPIPSRPVAVDFEEIRNTRRPHAEIFMTVDATDDQIAGVRAAVERAARIAQFAFIDKEEALEEYRRLFADDPDAQAATADELPVSFPIVFERNANIGDVMEKFYGFEGVDQFVVPDGQRSDEVLEFRCEEYDEGRARGFNDVEVFMEVRATPAEIEVARAALLAEPSVNRIKFFDKQAALREFRRIFSDDKDVLRDINAAALPTSFRIWLEPGADSSPLIPVADLPGVASVVDAAVGDEAIELCRSD